MALVDALLDLARNWDENVDPQNPVVLRHLIPYTTQYSHWARDVSDKGLSASDRARQDALRLVDQVSRLVRDDSSFFTELERSRTRDSPPVELPIAPLDFSPFQFLAFRSRRITSDEEFGLRVLASQLDPDPPLRKRARAQTINSLFAAGPQERRGLAIAVPSGRISPRAGRLRIDPVACALYLPFEIQTAVVHSFSQRPVVAMVPYFLPPDTELETTTHDVVETVNRLLGAARDPWGATSWWVTLNTRLGKPPADLLYTNRETEIISAAEAIQSDSF
jgi:hypothetical protein